MRQGKMPVLLLLSATPWLASATASNAVIEERQQIFEQLEDAVEAFKANTLEQSEGLQTLDALISDLERLPMLFPEGSHRGSKARSGVWQKPDQFAERLVSLNDRVRDMRLALAGGDAATFDQHLDAVDDSCNSCHMRFKKPF